MVNRGGNGLESGVVERLRLTTERCVVRVYITSRLTTERCVVQLTYDSLPRGVLYESI